MPSPIPLFNFSNVFEVSEEALEEHGAFNIYLVTDLPLFIDPFLLFASKKPEYRDLHESIIDYLRFLQSKSASGIVDAGLLDAWYRFKEVRETWLGFCASGNTGRGLGIKFARALNSNFSLLFGDFGAEQITKGTHLEKLCLIDSGVGRDMISDFTTNLIKQYLLEYTESFATKHIDSKKCKRYAVNKVYFDYDLERWQPKTFCLPSFQGKYVILTPADLLTRDENWINRPDMFRDFEAVPVAIPDDQLRAEINNYFRSILPKRITQKEKNEAIAKTLLRYPILIDYYIREKENNGERAQARSFDHVLDAQRLFVEQQSELVRLLSSQSRFYQIEATTESATRERILFLKDVIESKGGHRMFYIKGQPIQREEDLQILFRLTWFASVHDVSREVNDGRGPADFKISQGSRDKTIVEMKLATNPQLRRNLQNQVEIYKKASSASKGFTVILYFRLAQLRRVEALLRELRLDTNQNIYLIDACNDNKPSASKARTI